MCRGVPCGEANTTNTCELLAAVSLRCSGGVQVDFCSASIAFDCVEGVPGTVCGRFFRLPPDAEAADFILVFKRLDEDESKTITRKELAEYRVLPQEDDGPVLEVQADEPEDGLVLEVQ